MKTTLPPPLMSTTTRSTDIGYDVMDLSGKPEAERAEIVIDASASAPRTVFLLTRNARRRASVVSHTIYDIDDTLTESGKPEFAKSTADLLQQSPRFAHQVTYLTGRHARLVNPILEKHAAIHAEAYTELGAFRMREPGRKEHFLATPRHHQELRRIRDYMRERTNDLCRMHGVTLEPNLGGDHDALDSHRIVRNGVELDEDDDVIFRIMAEVHRSLPIPGWEVRDSSRETFDIVPAEITKANAMKEIIQAHRLPHELFSFADDSPNGADVHRAFPTMTRAVVYGRKSRPEMLRHADIATAGTANADPLIAFLQDAGKGA